LRAAHGDEAVWTENVVDHQGHDEHRQQRAAMALEKSGESGFGVRLL